MPSSSTSILAVGWSVTSWEHVATPLQLVLLDCVFKQRWVNTGDAPGWTGPLERPQNLGLHSADHHHSLPSSRERCTVEVQRVTGVARANDFGPGLVHLVLGDVDHA